MPICDPCKTAAENGDPHVCVDDEPSGAPLAYGGNCACQHRREAGPRWFRKKPVRIQAMQWTGNNIEDIWEWVSAEHVYWLHEFGHLRITTLEDGPDGEAIHIAVRGDWIIRGVQGELYPCKPDIFLMTYDPCPAGAAA